MGEAAQRRESGRMRTRVLDCRWQSEKRKGKVRQRVNSLAWRDREWGMPPKVRVGGEQGWGSH